MYYLSLGADPAQDVWTQVSPKHLPTPAQGYASAMVYDPDDDVLFAYGNIGNWIYCRTLENPTPGIATAKQRAAGCAVPDDWTESRRFNEVERPRVATSPNWSTIP